MKGKKLISIVLIAALCIANAASFAFAMDHTPARDTAACKVVTKTEFRESISTTLKVKPPTTSITSLTKGTKSFTVKWKKKTKNVSGYQIRYSRNSSMSDASKKTISGTKTTSKKITGLKGGKKYYVQVRTYKKVGDKKYYSAWSKKKSVITKKASGSSGDSTSDSGKVYYTETGSRYHFSKSCRGLSNANKIYSTTLSKAKSWGLTKCKYE